MKKRIVGLVLLAMLVALASASQAASYSVLTWTDYGFQPGATTLALSELGIAPTVAANEGDFVSKLGAGGWDLVILNNQNQSNNGARSAMAAWVSAGGRGIGCDWVNWDSTMVSGFGAAFTGGTNESVVYGTAHPIWAGVSSPIALTNPGWGVFSDGVSGATVAGTFGSGQGAIIVSGNSIFNGFLDDTYDAYSQGARVQLAKNEINYVLGGDQPEVPEPISMILASLGLGAVAAHRRKRAL